MKLRLLRIWFGIATIMMCSASAGFAQAGCRRPQESGNTTSFSEEAASTTVRVVKVTLAGQTGFTVAETAEIAQNLEGWHSDYKKGSRSNVEKSWIEEFSGTIRDAWQQRGYFKVKVDPQVLLTSEISSEKTFHVTATVDSGGQYRLGKITFKGGTQFGPDRLMGFFPLSRGEIFNTDRVRKGLEKLRKAYDERGFIDFSPVPTVSVDESHGLIDLAVEMEEGRQFRVSKTYISGLDPASAETLLRKSGLEPGDVADPDRLTRFDQEHGSNSERVIDTNNAQVCYEIRFPDAASLD